MITTHGSIKGVATEVGAQHGSRGTEDKEKDVREGPEEREGRGREPREREKALESKEVERPTGRHLESLRKTGRFGQRNARASDDRRGALQW